MNRRSSQQERNRVTLTGPLVLFDGVCHLCSGSVRFLATTDRTGRLYFAPIQSEVGQAVLRRYKLPLTDWDSFVFLEEGRVYLKAAALCRVIGYMRWPWTMLSVFRFLPTAVADWLYDRVARSRYALFGKEDQCLAPSQHLREKFLA